MKTCLVVRHVAFEDLGLFTPVLREAGFFIDYRAAGADAISRAEFLAADLVVVLGGPIGVNDREKYPFLGHELDLIRARIDADRPLIGVCLGAQLMAAACGARVYPGAAKEIGWGAISLTEAGLLSALAPLAAPGVAALHWHGDTFDLPAGAVRLASTEITPNQAFSIGRNALALQFHVEADPARIEEWLIGHTCELAHAGIAPGKIREETKRFAEHASAAGREALRRRLLETGLAR